MTKKRLNDEALPFETSIKKLQSIIELMEKDDTALEDSMKLFEEGINLTRQIQKSLSEAEQKVKKLVEADSVLICETFTPQNE